jgi:kynurenine formamidase
MKIIYLSYFLDEKTPLYGGQIGISIKKDRNIDNGDTANTKRLKMHNHSGTHIDFPNHFFIDGKLSEAYPADFWIFNSPFVIDYQAKENQIIDLSQDQLQAIPKDVDFLIIKTGFGRYRDEEKYWKYNPGISPDLALNLKTRFKNLRVFGVDLVSITSYQNREIGRACHRVFLSEPSILLIEDLDLRNLDSQPIKIIAIPLLAKGLDGAPVSIIAEING